ncbi:hypothetical protein BI380_00015 [Delftia tsuruhatensis]|uniref:Uncharacterized protein n=1 Tax=Delftia tsuruhatensis TaxID=180282 RepID=A0ABN4SC69_9BURK|nr:hypothetical protein BI380_00015 [Delftia tsuruhatensis]
MHARVRVLVQQSDVRRDTDGLTGHCDLVQAHVDRAHQLGRRPDLEVRRRWQAQVEEAARRVDRIPAPAERPVRCIDQVLEVQAQVGIIGSHHGHEHVGLGHQGPGLVDERSSSHACAPIRTPAARWRRS